VTFATRLFGLLFGLPARDGRVTEVFRDLRVPGADGADLLTDRYVPPVGRPDLPVVVIRTPYSRRGTDPLARVLAERGHHVVVQSCRGTFGSTGAFVPFGTTTAPGLRIPAALPCTAAVLRCDLDGTSLTLVAWGIRNAFGLGFLPDGRLLAVDQGPDDRGSRPIGAAPDLLYEVKAGHWYGWPDYIGGVPVTDPRFRPTRGEQPTFLLTDHRLLPPPEPAVVEFEPHAAATNFAVAPRRGSGTLAGRLVVPLFGDEAPMTAPAGHPRVGRGLVFIDPADWSVSRLTDSPKLNRPIDVGFAPEDGALHLLDFGQFEMSDTGVQAQAGTGRLWRWSDWGPTT